MYKEQELIMKWMIGIVSALGISVLSIGLALLFVGSDSSIAGHDENVSVFANNGLSAAINVHGGWSIDVTNPDGTLAEHREFNNALVLGGQRALAKLLGGDRAAGGWILQATANDPQNYPTPYAFYEAGEQSLHLGDTQTKGFNLIKEAEEWATSFSLSTSYTVLEGGTIDKVTTGVHDCPRSSQNCYGLIKNSFTKHDLPESITVLKDQKVNISVVFTFGS
jgi:hypothetical protein